MKDRFNSCRGAMLVEILIYLLIVSIVIGMVGLLTTNARKEYTEFDREGRLLFAHIKRIQLATLYGDLQHGVGVNRILLEPHAYRYMNDTKGLADHTLPDSMHLEFTGHRPAITFEMARGIGKIYTVTLVDDKIRYKRTYIFAQQSGRIRWEESRF